MDWLTDPRLCKVLNSLDIFVSGDILLKEMSYIRSTSHIIQRWPANGAASKDEDLLESVMHNANGLMTKEVNAYTTFIVLDISFVNV